MRSLFSFFLSAVIFLSISTRVQATVVIRGDGSVAREVSGRVLGQGSDSGGDDQRSGETVKSESSDSSGGSESKVGERKTETTLPDGTRLRTEVRSDGEARTEVRLGDGSRIRTRVEAGRRRVEVIEGGVKVRLEQEDGRFRIKVENQAGEEVTEVESEGEELLKIEERLDKNVIKIATGSAGRLVLSRNQFGATTSFPLSVDLSTNQLTVTTPAGSRVVAVLPDQAVKNMLAANALDRIGGLALAEIVREASPSVTLSQAITLAADRLGGPVYQIEGLKRHRLLGFLPVSLPRTVVVSAETGAEVEVRQSLLARLVDLLSPN